MGTITRLRLPHSPFVRAVLRSGLLTPDDLVGALAAYDPEQIATVESLQLATFLVRKKLLTKFQAMQLLSGRAQGFILGQYKILEGIRQDRVGMMFQAENINSKQAVAIKILPTDMVADPTVYRPFVKEVRAAAQVDHPNVGRVLDMGVWQHTHYVVTEHIPAPTLDKLLAEKGPMAPHEVGQVIAQVAIGLMHAHAKDLLHRDIKPANIALYPDRRVKLLDLGMTQLLENPWVKVTKRVNLKEYAEEIAHIAPEQAWGCELDARSDIYSLGSTTYTLLTGQPPFPGVAAQMMAARQLHDIPKPSQARPGVPPELDDLVQKMGAKDPHSRFQTAAELVAAMQPWLPVADWINFEQHLAARPVAAARPAEAPAPARKKEEAGFMAAVRAFFGRLLGKSK